MTADRAVLLLSCLAGGVGALLFGFTLEWDLLNYHLYNPHALVSGRIAIDVAPAQLQSYLNPALHLPVYLLFQLGGNTATVFVIGALQGGQLLLLIRILEELTGQRLRRPGLLLAVAVLGLAGPVFLNQLGASQGDTLLSALVLAGLLTVLRALRPEDASTVFRSGVTGGLLLGMAFGLKLTFAMYAVALGLACLLCFGGAGRWRVTSGLIAGGVLGMLLTAGAWFAYLWQTWGNPLFPYFNDLFASPWIEGDSYQDLRFMPRTVGEWLFYPVYWLADPQRVWEYAFRDVRVPLAIGLAFAAPLFAWRRMRDRAPALGLAWLFVVFSYLLWLGLFSIYRYLSVIEMLAPLLIFATGFLYLRSRRGVTALLVVLAATQLFVMHHRNPPAREFQPGAASALSSLPPAAMVVVSGYEPVAYAALWMDDAVPIVRIRSNFMNSPEPRHPLHELAWRTVRGHDGPHFLLLPDHEREAPFVAEDLRAVGLALENPAGCRAVFESGSLQDRLRLKLCPLRRLESGAQAVR